MKSLLPVLLLACVDQTKQTPHGAPILLGVPTTDTPRSAGTRPVEGKPEGTDLLPEIEHIVVLMMENHSFDNYFGALGRGDGLTLDGDGVAAEYALDANGQPVFGFHARTTNQERVRVSCGWDASHHSLDSFVSAVNAIDPMAYFNRDDIPYYYAIADKFPIADRYFASVLGPTYPNRRFLSSGTANGLTTTALEVLGYGDPPPAGTIYHLLDKNKIRWRNYTALLPELALYPTAAKDFPDRTLTIEDFLDDAAKGQLPQFSLVTPSPFISEEDPQDIKEGAAFAQTIMEAVQHSPNWKSTLMVFTYDEHGGYYDHVPPPPAFPPDDVPPDPTRQPDAAYDRLGFRVPAVVLSPFARPNYVSHVVHDHTSILRLVETKWNLPALTRRDANASNLLDMIDLWHPPAF